MAVGPYSITDYYMEAKRNQAEGTEEMYSSVVIEVAEGICRRFPAENTDFLRSISMEDAERAVVIIGSAAGTTKDAVDRLREQGRESRTSEDPSVPSIPG